MASRRLVLASVHEALLGIPSDIASLERNSLRANDDLDHLQPPSDSSGHGLPVRSHHLHIMQQSIKQAAAGVVTTYKFFLQPVAERHQFINLGYDTLLLGEGWKGDRQNFPFALADDRERSRSCFAPCKFLKAGGFEGKRNKAGNPFNKWG